MRKNKLQGKRKKLSSKEGKKAKKVKATRKRRSKPVHDVCGCPPVVRKLRTRIGDPEVWEAHCSDCVADGGASGPTPQKALSNWYKQQKRCE